MLLIPELEGYNWPRLMLAGSGGDSGKTLVSVALCALLRSRGVTVQPFKKGPDFIDPAWLTLAAGRRARNLDLWMMGRDGVLHLFGQNAVASGINLIEGNRGLFDGGSGQTGNSSAELAKLLRAPVVLVLSVQKVTATAGVMAWGLKSFDPDLNVVGVVLNRVGGVRHRRELVKSISNDAGLPVFGMIPRLADDLLPERHLGLVPPTEHARAEEVVARLADLAVDNLDVEAILRASRQVPPPALLVDDLEVAGPRGRARIGYFAGPAFTFYYPDNLEALSRRGANLVAVDPLSAAELPECDALLIGGGFPETHADRLAANRPFRDSVVRAVNQGLPVWAECGGLMYLAQNLVWKGRSYPMAGALPLTVEVMPAPQGHGYEEAGVTYPNPFLPVGKVIRGHEFHYSQVVDCHGLDAAFTVRRGTGMGDGRDGLLFKNVLACYLHVHAAAAPVWADGLISAAARRRAVAECAGATSLAQTHSS